VRQLRMMKRMKRKTSKLFHDLASILNYRLLISTIVESEAEFHCPNFLSSSEKDWGTGW
jgi:hypothetical protein